MLVSKTLASPAPPGSAISNDRFWPLTSRYKLGRFLRLFPEPLFLTPCKSSAESSRSQDGSLAPEVPFPLGPLPFKSRLPEQLPDVFNQICTNIRNPPFLGFSGKSGNDSQRACLPVALHRHVPQVTALLRRSSSPSAPSPPPVPGPASSTLSSLNLPSKTNPGKDIVTPSLTSCLWWHNQLPQI